MFIASKFEALSMSFTKCHLFVWELGFPGFAQEIYPPEVKDFVYITDNAYTKDDILNMEVYGLAVFCSEGLSNLERIQMLQIWTWEFETQK